MLHFWRQEQKGSEHHAERSFVQNKRSPSLGQLFLRGEDSGGNGNDLGHAWDNTFLIMLADNPPVLAGCILAQELWMWCQRPVLLLPCFAGAICRGRRLPSGPIRIQKGGCPRGSAPPLSSAPWHRCALQGLSRPVMGSLLPCTAPPGGAGGCFCPPGTPRLGPPSRSPPCVSGGNDGDGRKPRSSICFKNTCWKKKKRLSPLFH